jgi:outer membrane protein OmpA-like peptidoglycan-associated protein
MNNFVKSLVGVAILLLLDTGCSPIRNTVILTPDPDGHVGKAEVRTDGGKQLLEQPRAMTTVSRQSSSPSKVTTAAREYISATFSDVMAIEPSPAERYILFFHTNTTNMVSETKSSIATILNAIKRRRAVSICISGHTDSSGPFQFNEVLARKRAQAVRDLLIQQGVDSELLTVSSHGKWNQLVPTADGVAEPRNRRVEVLIR